MKELKSIPNLAIVGRPNVGKSALFNALARRRISIVDLQAGTTRDRVSAEITHNDLYVELVDTGGFEPLSSDVLLWKEIQTQIKTAMEEADVILFVTDIRTAVTGIDIEISKYLHRSKKPVILCVNKADTPALEKNSDEFRKLGFPPLPISALQKRGLDVLWEEIGKKLSVPEVMPKADPPVRATVPSNRSPLADRPFPLRPPKAGMTIAIIGKRNVGKSTLVNNLARKERTIVSEIPGTTRDSINVRFERDGKAFIAIDTAGAIKRKQLKEAVDIYGQQRTENSIKCSDVVILMLSAKEKVSEVDKKAGQMVIQNHKPCVIVINKWDLVNNQASPQEYKKYLDKTLPFVSYAPIVFISAKTGFNVSQMVKVCRQLYKQAGLTITTATLNKITGQIKTRIPLSQRGSKQPKIYYAVQSGSYPPTITLKVNNPSLFSKGAIRYIQQQYHKALPLKEVPLRIILKE
ncbi:MAG: ribosome biogenesis GTPase Der [Planctomycetota bacterium]|nr:ribosome biogenesis GTPase Der [Planctomycetota bacterium]MDI6788643.1 ribosome biogenesis GTPase Der [Planctomycetota bacterium]